MTREEFNKLEILEQLDYVNHQLKENKSLRIIGSELKMSKTTFRDRFTKLDYVYNVNTKQYSKNNALGKQSYQDNIKTIPKPVKRNVVTVTNSNVGPKYDNDILELIKHKTELLEMLKDYKNNTKITETEEFNINDLPLDLQTNIIRKTIKIYEPIYNDLNEICNNYGNFKRQDLVSLAILEFCNKYRKNTTKPTKMQKNIDD
ncbi:MAG TPA: hypothetical protein VIK86_10240 [Candidatus Paceibacterota bacterium]